MENRQIIKNAIISSDERQIVSILDSGLDPNVEGGWMIRLAARYGSIPIVKILINFGANVHLLSETGSSILQSAVYSGKHWESDAWNFLLKRCNPLQLADGAAVAIIFKNIPALKRILHTGRCNILIPTTLTGKTVEQLAKGYKLHHLLEPPTQNNFPNRNTPASSPRASGVNRMEPTLLSTPPQLAALGSRDLSPSVARFFHQTSRQTGLTPNSNLTTYSPTSPHAWHNFRVN